jgi:hypothetical protein
MSAKKKSSFLGRQRSKIDSDSGEKGEMNDYQDEVGVSRAR